MASPLARAHAAAASLLKFLSIVHAISVLDLTTDLAVITFNQSQVRLGFPTDIPLSKESLAIIIQIASERQVVILSFNSLNTNFTGPPIIIVKRTPNFSLNLILVQTDQIDVEENIVQATTLFRKVGERNNDYYVSVSSKFHAEHILQESLFMVYVERKILVYPASSDRDNAEVITCAHCSPGWKHNIKVWDGQSNWMQTFIDRKSNWQAATLRILSHNSPGHLQIVQESGNLYIKRGSEVQLLQALSLKHNLTFKLTMMVPKKPPKTFIEDMVAGGKVDFAMVTTPTAARLKVVDFTTPIGYSPLTFVTAVDKPVASWTTLVDGFDLGVWIRVGLSAAIATMVVWIFSNITQFLMSNIEHDSWSLASITAFIMVSLIRHGLPIHSKASVVRVFIIFWLMYAMIAGTVYESTMMSSLLFPSHLDVPKTWEELSSRPDIQVVFNVFHGLSYQLLSESTNSVYSTIFKKAKLQTNTTACLETVALNAKSACIVYYELAGFNAFTNPRLQFEFSAEQIFFIQITWMVRKNSLLTRIFNRVISAAVSTGLIHQWIVTDYERVRRENCRNGTCPRELIESDTCDDGGCVLQLVHLYVIFIVLAVGLLLAAFVFVVERVKAALKLKSLSK